MKNETIQRVIEIPIEDVRSEKYDQNIEKFGDSSNSCFICGKPIKDLDKSKFVQFLNTGNIVSTHEDHENSQGFFPVGNECAKKLIIKFT